MDRKLARAVLKQLFDSPLKDRELLIDRKKELDFLERVVNFQPGGVYGICGETGVGKTTVLNFIEVHEGVSIFLKLSEKDSKETIIGDLLYKLSRQILMKEKGKLANHAKKAIDFVLRERESSKSIDGGLSAPVNVSVSKNKSFREKFNVYEAYEYIDSLLSTLLDKHERLLLTIDELDKERKDEVLNILDSLKGIFEKEELIVIVSLPFSIYREYSKDLLRWNESGNLENILKGLLFVEPLSAEQIRQMILLRLRDFPEIFDGETLYDIAMYSDGNPRDALWIAQQIILHNLDKDRITHDLARRTIKEIVNRYFKGFFTLTDLQKQVLKAALDYAGDRQNLVKRLEKLSVKRQTAYTYISRLKDEGLLIEKDGKIKVSGKIMFLLI
ncbi:MAG: ATPase [Thermotogaceae bacterium]|nr:ATPase [Thermotogaceae bacterium]